MLNSIWYHQGWVHKWVELYHWNKQVQQNNSFQTRIVKSLVGTAKIIFNSTLNSRLLDKNWRFSTQSKIRHLQLIITRYMPGLLLKVVTSNLLYHALIIQQWIFWVIRWFWFLNAFYPSWIPIKLISIVWRLIMIPLTFGVSIDKLICGVDCSGSIGGWIDAFFSSRFRKMFSTSRTKRLFEIILVSIERLINFKFFNQSSNVYKTVKDF